MTCEEYDEKFDDEHQVHFKAVSELQAEEKQKQLVAFQEWDEMKKAFGF